MFVRFRQTDRRLQVSLIETHRDGDRVRHTHIASLGSILLAQSVSDRMAFWTSLHQRLAGLDNRIDADARFAILAAVNARVRMVTQEEQHAEQLARAEADARFWKMLDEQWDAQVKEGEVFQVGGERMAADAAAEKARISTSVTASQQRLARAQAGEIVAAPKPMTAEAMLKALGMTQSDLQHARRLGVIHDLGLTREFVEELAKSSRRKQKPLSRAFVLRALRRGGREPDRA